MTSVKEQSNPLLRKWAGPQGGRPPFDLVGPDLFASALADSMACYREEIARIASFKEAPTFENTFGALEDSGRQFHRVCNLFEVFVLTMNDAKMQALDAEWSPKFAQLHDEIIQDEKLFERIESIYESREELKLNSEQLRLVWLTYNDFARSGAKLNQQDKAILREINSRLATLYTSFSQNLLKDEEAEVVVIKDIGQLKGLSQSLIEAAAAEAKAMNIENSWVVRNTRSSVEPFLRYCQDRKLRQRVWQMFTSRGDLGGETDNKAVAAEILQLRYQRAQLLGFSSHAHWQLTETMAKTPEAALELMEKVWQPAVEAVAQEVQAMLEIAKEVGDDIRDIEPWDYRYYAEKVRKKAYDLDAAALEPYLQLEKILEAQFWVAQQLWGVTFIEVKDVPAYHPEVRVFEVSEADGSYLGAWYYDPFAREGKRSGAWMSEYRAQEAFLESISPIVSNNSNYIKGKPDQPVLITFDDAETMFHEFGHALHGLFSKVHYPTLAGTRVALDFVEFPSQFYEHWLSTSQVLKRFALHYQTKESMPDELIEKIRKAATFNSGFSTVEYLSSALLDMHLHLAGGDKIDINQFEKSALENLDMPRSMVMRHRLPQFAHVFSDDGYSAGYYSYLWAEVLDQDAWRAFEELPNPLNQELAARYRTSVLSVGNTIDPAEAYRRFRGAEPRVEALLASRGFLTPS